MVTWFYIARGENEISRDGRRLNLPWTESKALKAGYMRYRFSAQYVQCSAHYVGMFDI